MIEWPERNRPGFVAFHHDYREDGWGLGEPEDESYFDFEQIREYMRGVLVHPGNFFDLIDQFGETLQFYVNDDRTVQIDFIVEARRGSMMKMAPLSECIALVESAGPSLAALVIPGAVFQAW